MSTRTALTLILLTVALSGCNPEADKAYEQGRRDGQSESAKELLSQARQIELLKAQQKSDAFDAACSASLVCSLYHRISGAAPPRADAQPDPQTLKHHITALRVADGVTMGIFACALCFLWVLLQRLRYRLKLTEQAARLTESQVMHQALLGDIAEVKRQLVTLEHARQQMSRDLESSIAELMRRQKAMTNLQDAKARLEKELIALRKAHTTQKNQLRLSADQPVSTQATARSIFEPRRSD